MNDAAPGAISAAAAFVLEFGSDPTRLMDDESVAYAS
jgi:hypothetical protein